MAILINGNGNPAIYPDQDADWFASIFGGQTAITGVGSQFAAEIQDANTIALADGVIITKEGRRIQLDANQSDIFEIPTGAQGTTNYYIIGYCLTTNDDSSQTAETFVELMENATDTIEEDTFRDGADKVYVSLYRVTQTGFNLETPELLLPQVESITQLNADLSELSELSVSTTTLIDTITNFSDSIDVTLDFSQYNEIVFMTVGHYTNATDKFHTMIVLRPHYIELIRADSSNKTGNIAPSVIVGAYSNASGAFASVYMCCMNTANTYRFAKENITYDIDSVSIYGVK